MMKITFAALIGGWSPVLFGVGSLGFALGTTYGVAALLVAVWMEKTDG